MAINIKFDLSGNPEPPTIILATRNGNKLGQLEVDESTIELSDRLNDASEFSFTLSKYVDDRVTNLWDKVLDFKLVWCKEWDTWFEITVELDELTETVKTVFCKKLGESELSQIKLYNVEINTEEDIERDDYKIKILYDENNSECSLVDRLLEKAPHYSIDYVSPTIAKIQRSFSFNDITMHDAFKEIDEEIGCLTIFNSGTDEFGRIERTISIYDLNQNCNACGHRGEFTDSCPKCGSPNIQNGFGKDTLIFVTADELASSGIQLTTDTDSVKNCFKLEAGDDLMTATVRNCNPNGTDYIWRFSEDIKEDMSDELVEKLESYDELYNYYYNDNVSNIDNNLLNDYNALVDKYVAYNEDLQHISNPITGYSSLMNAYYNTIDLDLYLEHSLMPSVEMSETTAEEQAKLLTADALSPVSVSDITVVSSSTAESAVKSIAKIIVQSTYEVDIKDSNASELVYEGNSVYWKGNFTITNYSDEEDVAVSEIVMIEVNDDLEAFIKQKIEKALNKENTDDYSISGLFEKEYDDFCVELKKYALEPLNSFYEACLSCINIMTEQGVASGDTWGDTDEGTDSNLYEKLYIPYYNKLMAIESEKKVREDEINKVIEMQECIIESKEVVQDALNFENYLGTDLWLDFCAYRREDTYSNDNYISDGLDNAGLFKKALEFIEVANNEVYKASELQCSISTTLDNLLAIPKFKPLVKSFEVGNWIRVQIDDKIYKLRLLEYDIDFGDFDNISVEFSDVTKIKNGITDVQSVIKQAASMATSYDSIKRQAKQGDEAQESIETLLSNGLNTALIKIQSNDTEDVTFDKNGLLCRSYDDITDTYSPNQLKITHNVMAYTDNNWESVRLALGEHEYSIYDESSNGFIREVGYGLSADFVTAGVVSGSQIIGGDIYSDNYSVTDGTGSYLNLRDGTFSFGGGALRFEGGKLLISSPNIPTTEEITEINEQYLKTTSVYAENLNVKAANIQEQLTASQINTVGLIAENISATTISGKTLSGNTINNGNGTFYVDTNGNVTANALTANNANITGAITSSTITGTTINNGNGTFYVDVNGNVTSNALTATNANVSGTITTGNLNATGGYIGGIGISETGISYSGSDVGDGFGLWKNGVHAHNNSSIIIHAGANNTNIGGAAFRLYQDGSVVCDKLTANNANIGGVLRAGKDSSIGRFSVDENSIYSGAWDSNAPDVFISTGTSRSYTIANRYASDWAFGAGGNFGVTTNGYLYGNQARFVNIRLGGDSQDNQVILNQTNVNYLGATAYWEDIIAVVNAYKNLV